MPKKFKRLTRCAKELSLMLVMKPTGFICSKLSKKYKDLWLICERGDDARDNGYWFYKYLKESHPEINSRYIISRACSDYEKIARLGGAVEYKSLEHYLMYYSAKHLIGTHVQPCAPDKVMHYHLAKHHLRPHAAQTFLQHGIIKDDMSWLDGAHLYINLFICGAKPEYEHIRSTYNHPEGVVKYTGLARFDNLAKSCPKEKFILVMPTWRGSNYPSGKDFPKTEYFRRFNSLLNNQRLDKTLAEHGFKLVFYPHIEMQSELDAFTTASDRIIKADKNSHDVQELLMKCSLLITDYSSVFFDAAYLGTPTLYYQFDADEFHAYHYKKGYFDFERDGFGAVCTAEDALLAEIEKCFAENMKVSAEYQKRADKFFCLRDNQNCARIFDAICSIS